MVCGFNPIRVGSAATLAYCYIVVSVMLIMNSFCWRQINTTNPNYIVIV